MLFPPVGIGIAAAGAAGAAIGGVAGHATGGMPRGDLKDLGEALDSGTASLIAVYETNLADQVAANIKAANRVISSGSKPCLPGMPGGEFGSAEGRFGASTPLTHTHLGAHRVSDAPCSFTALNEL